MGAKATFNATTREIELTSAPVSGVVELDAIVDLYSDAKEDWLASATLQKLEFPFIVAGGEALPSGNVAPKIAFMRNDLGWRILPYDDDHDLTINGNLFPALASLPMVTKRAGRTVLVSLTTTLAGVDASAAADLARVRKHVTNRNEITGFGGTVTQTVYDDDGTTPLESATLTTDGGENVTTHGGVQTKRTGFS